MGRTCYGQWYILLICERGDVSEVEEKLRKQGVRFYSGSKLNHILVSPDEGEVLDFSDIPARVFACGQGGEEITGERIKVIKIREGSLQHPSEINFVNEYEQVEYDPVWYLNVEKTTHEEAKSLLWDQIFHDF